jgi:hypothetical protein
VKPATNLNLQNKQNNNQRPSDNSGEKDITKNNPPKVQSQTQVNNKNIKQISPNTPEIIENKAAKKIPPKTGENNSLFTQISEVVKSETAHNLKHKQNQPVNPTVNKPTTTAMQKPIEPVAEPLVTPKVNKQQPQKPVSQKPISQTPTTQPLKPQAQPIQPTAQQTAHQATQQTAPPAQPINPVLIKHPVLWEGKINLKIKDIMTQMHYITGNREISQKILGPQVGHELLKTLKISQRMRLNPDQISKSTNMIAEGQNCVTLCAVPCGIDEIDRGHQSDTMKKHFIEYLTQKGAAGVVSLKNSASIHIFSKSDFTSKILKTHAVELAANLADWPLLLIVVQSTG